MQIENDELDEDDCQGGSSVRIAIVDDDAQERERIATLTKQYFDAQNKACHIALFADGDELLEEYQPEWDLILLDIQMSRMDGMAAAEMIRKVDRDVFLVFVTNMAHYAIKGYGVRALDFLLKPVNARMLAQVLGQVEHLLAERQKKMITLQTQKGVIRLNVSEILYVEVANHVLSVVTTQGVISLRGTISGVENLLADYGFFRCNNCYVVNLAHVSRAEQGVAVVGGHELAVSRPRQKKFMEALTRYIGGSEGYE